MAIAISMTMPRDIAAKAWGPRAQGATTRGGALAQGGSGPGGLWPKGPGGGSVQSSYGPGGDRVTEDIEKELWKARAKEC